MLRLTLPESAPTFLSMKSPGLRLIDIWRISPEFSRLYFQTKGGVNNSMRKNGESTWYPYSSYS
nr:hypothetical protein Iba_chr11eCG7990 [Ipomoea batatas]